MRHSVSLLVSLVLFLQPACAHKPPPLPSEEIRAGLGTIGVFSVQHTFKPNLTPLAKGPSEGALTGAADTAMEAGRGAPTHPITCLACPFIMLGGAAVGSVVGATKAVSVEEAEPMEASIRNAFSELRIEETMAELILRDSRELTDYTFYPSWQSVLRGKVDYGPFKGRGIDTALEVAVTCVQFEGGHWKDEPAALWVCLHTRLIRTADNTVLYEKGFLYMSPRRRYANWAHDDARLFVEEFERACGTLAEKLIEEIFLRYQFGTV
jgi:hypothetical protein